MENETNTVTIDIDPADAEANMVMGIIAYILFLIPLLAAKDSKFAMYHANQGLVLFLIGFGLNVILTIIPIVGWLLLPFANLGILVLAIIGIINAAQKTAKPLPLIGGFNLLK